MTAEQQFVLRWHYQELTLLRNLPAFLDSDVMTDVTLSVESHNLKAHRLVLAMCSVYFLQLFQELGDKQHPVIVLHNVALSDIRAVLAFIYRGHCTVSEEQLPSLLSVAKLLKIQGLCDMKVPARCCNSNNNKTPHTIEKRTETSPNRTENAITQKPEQVQIIKDTSGEKTEEFPQNLHKLNDCDDSYCLPPLKRAPKDLSETCKCFLCGKYLSNQYNLRVHMETHEEAYHACQNCPHVSRSRDALRKHVSYRHPEEYHTRKRKKVN